MLKAHKSDNVLENIDDFTKISTWSLIFINTDNVILKRLE